MQVRVLSWVVMCSVAMCSVAMCSVVASIQPRAVRAQEAPASQAERDAFARRIFSLGSRAYEEEHYADAAAYFERAYNLSGRGELMYNIAIARERQGERQAAVTWFERYLTELPSGVRIDEVRVRLQVLRQTLAEEAEAQQAEARQAEAQRVRAQRAEAQRAEAQRFETAGARESLSGSGGGSPVAGWAVASGGLALTVSGVLLMVLAGSAASTVEDAPQGTYWVEVEGDADRATLFSALGAVGIGLGGATAVGGLIWALLSQGDNTTGAESQPEAFHLAVGPGTLTLEGSF